MLYLLQALVLTVFLSAIFGLAHLIERGVRALIAKAGRS